jgi:hypothetical protein
MEAISTTPGASSSRREPEQVGSSTAVTSARTDDAVGDVVERSPRVKLNVSVKAPVVYVPRNIHSLEAFVGDFGEIKIINEFRLGTALKSSHSFS